MKYGHETALPIESETVTKKNLLIENTWGYYHAGFRPNPPFLWTPHVANGAFEQERK